MASTADRMRKAANLMVQRGLRVQYASGWESRSNGYSFNPSAGFIDHHTAATSDIDSVLINGRSDLPGPLCQWALHKDGTWVLIAAGGANHAGASVSGAPTNSTGWGCEATGPIPLDGYGPSAFPNYDAYVTGMACILEAEGWGTDKVWGHKESASPLGRKIDPSFDMGKFRSTVNSGGGGSTTPVEEPMTMFELCRDANGNSWMFAPGLVRQITDPNDWGALKGSPLCVSDDRTISVDGRERYKRLFLGTPQD